MQTCVIISEYNPFHNGHAWQIDYAKKVLGFDAVICLMSGAFVQRGEPAILSAFDRAACAIASGASLVLEYPAPNVLQSSVKYAEHAVAMASGLGADALVFGTEKTETSLLIQAAETMQTKAFDQKVGGLVKEGHSQALAVRKVLLEYYPNRPLLSSPNNTLALAYISAIQKHKSPLKAIGIPRVGAGYADSKLYASFSSATAIRKAFKEGRMEDIKSQVPPMSFQALQATQGLFPALSDYESILHYFVTFEPDRLKANPHYENGLENHLAKQMKEAKDFNDFLARSTSKRYTKTRIQRLLSCALIGIEGPLAVQSYRPLAGDDLGQKILRRLQDQGVPILTRYAQIRDLPLNDQKAYTLSMKANDLRNMALGLPMGQDYLRHPTFFSQDK